MKMKITVKTTKDVDIKTLVVKAHVRYWEDSTINGVEDEDGTLTPCREGELWCPIIDVDTGIITNWTKGVKASVHFKVCDAGCYYLKDAKGSDVLMIEHDYVPAMLAPKENGYGDYIIMDIDENGKIDKWNGNDLDGFENEDD